MMLTMHRLFGVHENSVARDTRGYLYGLGGILKAVGLAVPRPDYTKSMPDVFEDMTLVLIQSTGSLLPMKGVFHDPNAVQADGDTIGSWVMDWRISCPKAIFQTFNFTSSRCKVSRGNRYSVPSIRARGQLPLTGCAIGKIRQTKHGPDRRPSDEEWFAQLLIQWTEFAQSTMRIPAWNGARAILEIFFNYTDTRTHYDDSPAWHTWAQTWFADGYRHRGNRDWNTVASPDALDFLKRGRGLYFPANIQDVWLFSLESGHLGMLHSEVQIELREDDQVVIVAGLDVPLILRPVCQGLFSMVAPCIVVGVMYGEAWPESPAELETFVVV